MKHRVLIPLDGSEFSRQILTHVRKFLSPATHELMLMQAAHAPIGATAHPPRVSEIGVSMYETERDAILAQHPVYASQELESTMANIKRELETEALLLEADGYTVSTLVRFGEPAQEIVDTVEDENIDLIAMTTHGLSGLSRLIFGSVAQKVVRQAPVPVMLVRPTGQT
jgi:nucleotide-binding universal stress UspA family protein